MVRLSECPKEGAVSPKCQLCKQPDSRPSGLIIDIKWTVKYMRPNISFADDDDDTILSKKST